MTESKRSFMELARLLTPLFGVIGAVWALRFFVSSFSGVPSWLIQVFSVTIAVPVCVILMAILIHVKRFGGYTQVVVGTFMLVTWAQLLIVAAILFSVWTGIDTIYTAPEYSMTNDPNHVRHIIGHLTFGIGIESLTGSAMGSIILYMMRRTSPRRKRR